MEVVIQGYRGLLSITQGYSTLRTSGGAYVFYCELLDDETEAELLLDRTDAALEDDRTDAELLE